MTFFEFCCEKFDAEWKKPSLSRNPIFDMAFDARRDLLYPRDSIDREVIRKYLISQNAPGICLENFEKVFDLYVNENDEDDIGDIENGN